MINSIPANLSLPLRVLARRRFSNIGQYGSNKLLFRLGDGLQDPQRVTSFHHLPNAATQVIGVRIVPVVKKNQVDKQRQW